MMNDDDADEIDINDEYYDYDEIDNHLFFALTVDLSQVRVSLQVQSQVPAQILQICKSGKLNLEKISWTLWKSCFEWISLIIDCVISESLKTWSWPIWEDGCGQRRMGSIKLGGEKENKSQKSQLFD